MAISTEDARAFIAGVVAVGFALVPLGILFGIIEK